MHRTCLAALALVLVAAAPDWAAAKHCRAVRGDFSSALVVGPPCASQIGMCTSGVLSGDLDGTYDFTFQSLVPANDPNDPGAATYTGASLIALDRGGARLFG